MKYIFWTPRALPEIGGLQKSVDRLSNYLASLGKKVVLVTATDTPNCKQYDVIYSGIRKDFIIESNQIFDKIIKPGDALYVCGIFHVGGELQLELLPSISKDAIIILRIASSDMVSNLCSSPHIHNILKRINYIVCLNKNDANTIKSKYHQYDSKVFAFHNSIEKTEVVPECNILTQKNVYLHAARIEPNKNTLELIQAWTIFTTKYLDRELHIYGIPYNERYFNKCIQKINRCNSIHYKGNYSPEQKKELFSNVKFIVIPSISEGHPNTLNECMVYNKIAILTTINGHLDHIEKNWAINIDKPYQKNNILKALVESTYLSDIDYKNRIQIMTKHRNKLYEAKEEIFLLNLG